MKPGAQLGPYQIVAPIGAGGMGEVYRAHDPRLNRDVAIKVLPADFARDAERLRRFEIEARAVSALNHPNILTIFDIGSTDATPYVVYELLEGETLRARLSTGALPQRRALDFASQMAQGLAAAHDKGITHRDLKPDNLFVTHDGRLKILDFGLAKVSGPAEDIAATMSAQTNPGAVLGTAGYMSPEQVRGEASDHRADIFSFGVILYEMLSGRRAFHADTAVSTMHAILASEPTELEHTALDRLLRHCMEKSPAMRFQSARDIGFALEAVGGSSTSTSAAAITAKPTRTPWLAAAIVVLAIAAAAAFGYWLHARRNPNPTWSASMLAGPAISFGPRVSPDGRSVAFQAMVDGMTQVAIVNPSTGAWTVLTQDRTHGYVASLCWSRDGNTIYYARSIDLPHGVYAVPALGGEERLVLEEAGRPESLTDGSLLVTKVNAKREPQMYHFWPQSGKLEALPALISGDEFSAIRSFPDGKEAAFYGRTLDSTDLSNRVRIIDLATGKVRGIGAALDTAASQMAIDSIRNAVVVQVPAGNLRNLVAVPRTGGEPTTILSSSMNTWFLDIGADGAIYLDNVQRTLGLVRFPTVGGVPEQLPIGGLGYFAQVSNNQQALQLPDGRSLVSVPAGLTRLIAIAPGKNPQNLLQTDEESYTPAAPMRDRIAFVLGRNEKSGIAIASLADGRILKRLVTTGPSEVASISWSADMETIFYSSAHVVWAVPAAGGQPRRIAEGDSATLDAGGKDLLVKLDEASGSRLMRVAVGGGAPRPVELQMPPGLRLTVNNLVSRSVAPDGRIAIGIASSDSWYYHPAVIDPSGKLSRIPVAFDGDVDYPEWTSDGKLVAPALPMHNVIWRFQAVK